MSGAFEIPVCGACGHAVWPPRLVCPSCGAREWKRVDASEGTLEEVSELAGSGSEPVRLCSVRLDAGPTVIARGEGGSPGERVSMALLDGVLLASGNHSA